MSRRDYRVNCSVEFTIDLSAEDGQQEQSAEHIVRTVFRHSFRRAENVLVQIGRSRRLDTRADFRPNRTQIDRRATLPAGLQSWWFAQRQHPTKPGMIQVSSFNARADADAQVQAWKAEDSNLHPYTLVLRQID